MNSDRVHAQIDSRLVEYREIWRHKRTLRVLYHDYHRRLIGACPDGPLLDVGGGTGHVKDARADVVSVDILAFPGIDVVCDAHTLPFVSAQFSGIVMLDVLHHLVRPTVFLREAARVLRPGGVLAMIEPGMSPIAYPFYRHLHQEPADRHVDPFAAGPAFSGTDPFDSNQAIPTVLFDTHNRSRLVDALPEMALRRVEWLSLFAFPLSGGFKRWCLIPAPLAGALVKIEDRLPAAIRRFAGFRIFVVMEKLGPAS